MASRNDRDAAYEAGFGYGIWWGFVFGAVVGGFAWEVVRSIYG